MKEYSSKIQDLLKVTRVVTSGSYDNRMAAKALKTQQSDEGSMMVSLFADEDTIVPELKVVELPVVYASSGDNQFYVPVEDISSLVTRADKAKEEQLKRTKDKAEVFTPAWICNLQNNLIDEATDYLLSKFNTTDEKRWVPTSERIEFSDKSGWLRYLTERRMEITCGEAPYLVSRYDAATGKRIPVKDEKGRFCRIGILDRKLRVASERSENVEEWKIFALISLGSTAGYEWQGDNLILGRVNLLETLREYYLELWKNEPEEEFLEKAAEIISWQLWQMDGLKQVYPNTCSQTCKACADKQYWGHDGKKAALRFRNPDSETLNSENQWSALTPEGWNTLTMDDMLAPL